MSNYKKILSLCCFILVSSSVYAADENSNVVCKSINERTTLTFYNKATLIKQDTEEDPAVIVASGRAIQLTIDDKFYYYASFDENYKIEENVQSIVIRHVASQEVVLDLNKIYINRSDRPTEHELGYFIQGMDPRDNTKLDTPLLVFCKEVTP